MNKTDTEKNIESSAYFHWADYVLFVLCLAVCVVIGVYHRCSGGRQKTTSEFLVGDRKLHLLPVGLSLQATLFSASIVLGSPVEVYSYGFVYVWIALASAASIPFLVFIFIPIFRRTKAISAYEYLEHRFSTSVRIILAAAFVVKQFFYMGIALYVPALAFTQVTGLPLWLSEIGTGLVCVLYTTMGGMKAVVWTDAFQVLVIGAGIVALLAKGIASVGGLDDVYTLANQNGRMNALTFDIDPTRRLTFWTQLVGGLAFVLTMYAADQSVVQRYLSLPTTRQAQMAGLLGVGLQAVTVSLCGLLGVVMTAFFAGCDPLRSGAVERKDQLVPYFMMRVLGEYHGLPGVFLACVFSAALSTLSSGCNSVAAVCLEDFVKPLYKHKTQISEKHATRFSKLCALVFGLLAIAVANVAPMLGTTVVQITIASLSAIGGPMLGVFILGIFGPPFVNSLAAIVGVCCGLAVSIFLSMAAVIHKAKAKGMPDPNALRALPVTNCTLLSGSSSSISSNGTTVIPLQTTTPLARATATSAAATAHGITPPPQTFIGDVSKISFMWIALISILTTVIVGLLVGALVALICRRKSNSRSSSRHETSANASGEADGDKEIPLSSKTKEIELDGR